MRTKRLRDSHLYPFTSRAEWMEHRLGLRAYYQDPAPPPEPDPNPDPDPDPEPPPPPDPDNLPDDPVELKRIIKETRTDRNRKGRNYLDERTKREAAEKKLSAAEAKLKEIEDKDKSEHQKALERAEKAEKAAAKERKKSTRLELGILARDANVDPNYSKHAIAEFLEAKEEDPDLDPKKFFTETLKKSHSLFYLVDGKPAVRTAGGSPPEPNPTATKIDKEIAEYEELLKTERNQQKRIEYNRAIRLLKEQKAQGG